MPGIDPADWTPRELRHSFVSLLSDAGVPIEEIARLVGHSGTTVTELVYRHQLRPVIQTGATVMDRLFASAVVHDGSHADSHSAGAPEPVDSGPGDRQIEPDAMKERGLRSSWTPGRSSGCLLSRFDEGGPL